MSKHFKFRVFYEQLWREIFGFHKSRIVLDYPLATLDFLLHQDFYNRLKQNVAYWLMGWNRFWTTTDKRVIKSLSKDQLLGNDGEIFDIIAVAWQN
jgi:hypothetical protein